MTLNELKYIVAVAKEKHFGRAAATCYISQPTLSVAVKKLEEELGISLFERRKGQINVTPIGARVIDKAQHILEEASCIKQLAQRGQDQLEGPVRFGAIYTVGPYLLPRLIPHLNQAAPQMPLIVEEDYAPILMEKLKCGDLDVVLVSLPFNDPVIRTMPLYEEPFVLLIPGTHPFNQLEQVSPDQLKDENVLMLNKSHGLSDQIQGLCAECTMHTGLHHSEGNSLETIRCMVASGYGISVMPCTAANAKEGFPDGVLEVRHFSGTPPKRTIALAWRKSFPRPLAINAIREAASAIQFGCITAMP